MGKYLDIIERAREAERPCERSETGEITHAAACIDGAQRNPADAFFRLDRFFRTFSELERRCPEHVEVADWQQAVEDGRRFLAQWGEQAEALGWSGRDLFGLMPVPQHAKPSLRRLSRYDHTGLVWLLRNRPVVALTEISATIRLPGGRTQTYHRRRG